MNVAPVGSKHSLLLGEVLAIAGDNALGIEHHHILATHAKCTIKLRARNGGSTSTIDNHLHVLNILSCHLEGILQSGSRNDGRTMLVVMHHWYVERLLQTFFNVETLRRLDVFQIDATKRRGDTFNSFTKLLGVFLVYLNIKDVNAAINLEKKALTFHDRLTAHSTNIAQAQHGRSIRDNRNKVALVGIFINIVGIALNLQTRECDTRRISQ